MYPQQPGYGQPIGYVPPQQFAAPTSNAGQGLGITSMVLGILSILTSCAYGLGLVLAILAVIFGHVAHSQSKQANGRANGMAVTGLVCGYISLGVVVLVMTWLMVVFGSIAHSLR